MSQGRGHYLGGDYSPGLGLHLQGDNLRNEIPQLRNVEAILDNNKAKMEYNNYPWNH